MTEKFPQILSVRIVFGFYRHIYSSLSIKIFKLIPQYLRLTILSGLFISYKLLFDRFNDTLYDPEDFYFIKKRKYFSFVNSKIRDERIFLKNSLRISPELRKSSENNIVI